MSSLLNVGSLSKVLLFLMGGRFTLRVGISKGDRVERDYENEILAIFDYNNKRYIDIVVRTVVEFVIGSNKIILDPLNLELFLNKINTIYKKFDKYFVFNDNGVVEGPINEYPEFLTMSYDKKLEFYFKTKDGLLGGVFVINGDFNNGCYVNVDELGAMITFFRKCDIHNLGLTLLNTYMLSSDVLIFTDQPKLVERG